MRNSRVGAGTISKMNLRETILASGESDCVTLICPCCFSGTWETVQRVRFASLSKCSNCGLLATTSFLKKYGALEALYDVTPQNHEEYRKHYLASRLSFYNGILPKLDRFRQTSHLLEVGSGYGYFLGMASQRDWDAEGVEISQYACDVARSRGYKVHQQDLLAVQVAFESYDVVVMWDVIEHLANVGPIVERCAALLRPGGALIARTPDGRALNCTKGFMAAAYRHFAYPANTAEHIFHFTPETLSLLVTRNGLKEIEIDSRGAWEERPVSGRSAFVRIGRYLVLRHSYIKGWPYEFVMTAVKG
jgi:2-polyprenyl-3-methyl-5-hydroxy-6-metoxy-1,4-benzoquinol methylase